MNKEPGTLYIVATPLGNLKDMSLRAIEVLKSVDYIAAEDTRHSAPLLQNFMIQTPMVALHEHNERDKASQVIMDLQQGKSVALISDAGTPLISDPGYFLVHEAHKLGVRVMPIPGACAAITALCASGMPTDRFTFEGFLPAKAKQRQEQLEALRHETRTMLFYEAPHRILETLQAMEAVFGAKRQVVLARELTKLYETIRAGMLAELVQWVESDANQQRGEIVLVVAGAEAGETSQDQINTDELLTLLLDELPLKKAVEVAAKISKKRKNELYQQALGMKKQLLQSFGAWGERKESSVEIVNDLRRDDERELDTKPARKEKRRQSRKK